jgi:hypothetical protein
MWLAVSMSGGGVVDWGAGGVDSIYTGARVVVLSVCVRVRQGARTRLEGCKCKAVGKRVV